MSMLPLIEVLVSFGFSISLSLSLSHMQIHTHAHIHTHTHTFTHTLSSPYPTLLTHPPSLSTDGLLITSLLLTSSLQSLSSLSHILTFSPSLSLPHSLYRRPPYDIWSSTQQRCPIRRVRETVHLFSDLGSGWTLGCGWQVRTVQYCTNTIDVTNSIDSLWTSLVTMKLRICIWIWLILFVLSALQLLLL